MMMSLIYPEVILPLPMSTIELKESHYSVILIPHT